MKTVRSSSLFPVILLLAGFWSLTGTALAGIPSENAQGERPANATGAEERKAKRDKLLADADKAAKDQKKVSGAAAAALRHEEGEKRLLAELLSEDPVNTAALEIAKALRVDPTVQTEKRLEIARLLQMAARKGRKFADRDEWQRQREVDAVQLVSEFPGQSEAHEDLLQVAATSPGPRSIALAQQIAISSAPERTKRAAAELVQRQTFDGRDIQAMLVGMEGAEFFLRSFQGKRVVFYTWAPEDEHSILRALEIAQAALGDSMVIGVNLGPDSAKALAAAQRGLPGQQLYGGSGRDSPLVQRLLLTRVGLIHAVGSDGKLKNLSAERDPAGALAKLN